MMTGAVMVVAVLGIVFVAATAAVVAFSSWVARQGVRQFRGNSCGMAHVPFAVH